MFGRSTVLVVNGPARAGKDTSIAFMKTALGIYGYQTEEFSSIDPVRAMLHQAGVNVHDKTPEVRAMLANIGDQLRDFRIDVCARRINQSLAMNTNGVFFLHMREWPLIEKLRARLRNTNNQISTVLINNPRVKPEPGNDADAKVLDYPYDFTIQNPDSLAELAYNCTAFVERNWERRA